MRPLLILAALAALAGPALAQPDQVAVDRQACNHGAPYAPATIEACARLKHGEGASQPAPTPTPQPDQPAPPPPVASATASGVTAAGSSHYTPPHFTAPTDDTDLANAAGPGVPAVIKAPPHSAQPVQTAQATPSVAAPAPRAEAASPPTDVGEAPVNGDESVSPSADNGGESDVGIHGGWLKGLGAFAVVMAALAALVCLPIYFLPTIIAIAGHKRGALWIFVLNLLFGWSVIGWIAALIWSLASEREY